MAKIENHKYSIEEAFRECFYIVPDYQREYVWTDKEVNQILEDIDDQLDGSSAREYFIGMILVSPTDQKNHYDVIDGQQRLTTFFLLLCAMKQLFRGDIQAQTIEGLISAKYMSADGEIVRSLKLEPRYESAGELMNKIVEMDADPEATRAGIQAGGITTFGSLENLVGAYATLYRYLKDNYPDKAALKKYLGYLANSVVFIQISTDVSSALKIFETINERGVGLNPMDLLKNLLFTQVKRDEFTRLKDEWKKVTKPLERSKEKPLRFLRYFLMANYAIKIDRGAKVRGDAVVREDEIYDWFVKTENEALCGYTDKPFEFVRKLTRNVEQYLAFAGGRGNDDQPNIAMGNLQQLTGGAFSLHYVLLLSAAAFPKPLFDHFVSQLESFLFYYIFTKTPTKELERNFSEWADELREIGATRELRKQIQKLNTFMQAKFQANMNAKEPELADALKRMTLNSMQQYRTRYFLMKLTQYVDMAYRGLKTVGSLSDYRGMEIEHILPNNPKTALRAEFEANNPKSKYDEYRIKIGNLTLLEKPLNIVASNDYFAKKLPEYAKCKFYLTSSIAGLIKVGKDSSVNRINRRLESFGEWTAKNIDKRQALLAELAKAVWKIVPLEEE